MAWTHYLQRITVDDTFDLWRSETNKIMDTVDEYRLKIDTEDQLNGLFIASGSCDDWNTAGNCSVLLDEGILPTATTCSQANGTWSSTHPHRESCENSGHIWTPHKTKFKNNNLTILEVTGGETIAGTPALDHSMSRVHVFSTQESTSYTTGALVVDGGVGIAGNLNVKGDINFLAQEGTGGTITFGDANTDNVVFGADIDSNIIPDNDDTYDLGSSTQEWRDLWVDGHTRMDQVSIDTDDGIFNVAGSNAFNFNVGDASNITVGGMLTISSNDYEIQNSGVTINGTIIDVNSTASTTITSGINVDISSQFDTEIVAINGDIKVNSINGNLEAYGINSFGSFTGSETTTTSQDIIENANQDINNTAGRTVNISATSTDVNISAGNEVDIDADTIQLDGTSLVNIGGSETTTNVNVLAQNNIDIHSIGSTTITGDQSSSVNTSSGRLTISGDDGVTISGNNATTIIDASGQTLDVDATTIDIDATTFNVAGTNTSTIESTGGDLELNAFGDVDVDGDTVTVDGTTGINIGTNSSGVPVTIGHSSSEVTFGDNVTITGDLIVQGDTTTIEVATMVVEDKNIELGNVTTPTDTTANGGGITLHGDTDHTITWVNDTNGDYWNISEKLNVDNVWANGNDVYGDVTLNIYSDSGTVNLGNDVTTLVNVDADSYVSNTNIYDVNATTYTADGTDVTLTAIQTASLQSQNAVTITSNMAGGVGHDMDVNSGESDINFGGYNISFIAQNNLSLEGEVSFDGFTVRNTAFTIKDDDKDLVLIANKGVANIKIGGNGGLVLPTGPESIEPWHENHSEFINGSDDATVPPARWGTCTLTTGHTYQSEADPVNPDQTWYSVTGDSQIDTKTNCLGEGQCHILADTQASCEGSGGAWAENHSINYQCVMPYDVDGNALTTQENCLLSGGVWTTGYWSQPLAEVGHIRFNTDTSNFEGFDGVNFRSLEGTRDTDNDTFIRAEETTGGDQDVLEFWTNGVRRLNVQSNGHFEPNTDNAINLGSSTKEFKNLYVDSTAYLDDVEIHDTTASIDNTSGSLRVAGGTGIVGDVNIGGSTDIDIDLTVHNNVILGDDRTQTIDPKGDFVSSITPNANNEIDLGTADEKFANLYVHTKIDLEGDIDIEGDIDMSANAKLTWVNDNQFISANSNDLSIGASRNITIDTGSRDIADIAASAERINIGYNADPSGMDYNSEIYIGSRSRTVNSITQHSTVKVEDDLEVRGSLTIWGDAGVTLIPIGGLSLGMHDDYFVDDTQSQQGYPIYFDRDANTKLYCENDDELYFVIGGQTRGTWTNDRLRITSNNLEVDNIRLDTNTIDTLSGDLNLDSNGGNVNVNDNLNVSGNTVIDGNLTVHGDTVTLNTSTLTVEDNIVVLNKNVTGTPTLDSGLEVERGDLSNATLQWIEADDLWKASSQFRVDNINFDGNTITTTSGGLTINSSNNNVVIEDNVNIKQTLDVDSNLNVDGTATIDGTTTISSNASIASDLEVNGVIRPENSIAFNGSSNSTIVGSSSGNWFDIYNNTADGSDNKALRIAGGGDVTNARGATIALFGNEVANSSGDIVIESGAVGDVFIKRQNATKIAILNDAIHTYTKINTNDYNIEMGTGDLYLHDLWTTGNVDVAGTINAGGITLGGNITAPYMRIDNIELDGNTIRSINNTDLQIYADGGNIIQLLDGVNCNTYITVDNIKLDGNTISTTSGDLTLDAAGNDITTSDNVSISARLDVDNIRIDGNTISTTNSNGSLTLSANGSGVINIDDTLDVDGITYLDNIKIDGNTITTQNSNGDLHIDAHGSGKIKIDTNTIIDGTLTVDNTAYIMGMSLSTSTISSTGANQSLYLNANGDGKVEVTDSLTCYDLVSSGDITGANGYFDQLELDGTTITSSGGSNLTLRSATSTVTIDDNLYVKDLSADQSTWEFYNTSGYGNTSFYNKTNSKLIHLQMGSGVLTGYYNGYERYRTDSNGLIISEKLGIDTGSGTHWAIDASGNLNCAKATNVPASWTNNYYVNGASFNTEEGILLLERTDGGEVTVDLDGRYALEHSHPYLPLTGGTISGALTVQDKLYIGANHSGIDATSSNSYYYDDLNNTWRTFGWHLNNQEFVIENNSGEVYSVIHSGNITNYTNDGGRVNTSLGSYGSVNVSYEKNGWAGYSIHSGQLEFLHNGSSSGGIHADYGWILYATAHAWTRLYYGGDKKLSTSYSGIDITGEVTESSSRRWKTNISTLENSLENVNKLRGVEFDFDEEHGGKHSVGLIAEEVREIYPDAVNTDEDGEANGVAYSHLVAPLIEAVKELTNKVEAQALEIEELKKRNK